MPMAASSAAALMLLTAAAASASARSPTEETPSGVSGLYGVVMVDNSPGEWAFFKTGLSSGNVTLIGDPLTQEVATSAVI